MQLSLLFADSEVSSVEAIEGTLSIRLSAASVESLPEPGASAPSTGYALDVVLRLQGLRTCEKSEPAFGRIRSGVLRVQSQNVRSVTLPAELSEPVELELAFANGASLLASAPSFSAAFGGEANFHESLAC